MKNGILIFAAICLLYIPLIATSYHQERLALLKNKGFNPQVIYDIGAHYGNWTAEIQNVFNRAQFFLFEANDYYKPWLQRLNAPCFFALLGDKEELVTFYTNNTSGDSVFREQTHYYADGSFRENLVPMTTLDTMVQKNKLPLPDLIKMDVQGAEKLIIKGGLPIVCNAHVIILEVGILEYNKGAPLMHEMMQLMDELGYCVLDVLELHYIPTGELIQIDLLFVKKGSPLIKSGILC